MNDLDSLAGEVRALEAQVRFLERENRNLRSTLWDSYFCAAMKGILAGSVFERSATSTEIAASIADEMLKIREARA